MQFLLLTGDNHKTKNKLMNTILFFVYFSSIAAVYFLYKTIATRKISAIFDLDNTNLIHFENKNPKLNILFVFFFSLACIFVASYGVYLLYTSSYFSF